MKKFTQLNQDINTLNETLYNNIKDLINKGKYISKNIWYTVKIEGIETKIAYDILVKIIRSEDVNDYEKLFLKKHSLDLIKSIPIIVIQGVPFSIPLTTLMIILSKKIGVDLLPKDYRYLLKNDENQDKEEIV